MPALFLVGAAKAGTSALFDMLAQHPGIHPSRIKEPHFFSHEGKLVAYRGPGDDETINREVVRDAKVYEQLFAPESTEAVRLEASTSYLYLPDTARNIHRRFPDARIVAVLRDPVERAYSAYLFLIARGYETLSFEDALAAEPKRIAGGWHHIWHYADMGRYAEQLARFRAVFPDEQILILEHSALQRAPQDALKRIYRLCNLPPAIINTDMEVNRSGRPKSLLAGRLLFQENSFKRMLVPMLPTAARKRVSSLLRKQLLARETMPATAEAWVLDQTIEDSRHLAKQHCIDISQWRGMS